MVSTNGCFDLLHIGHVRALERAKGCGDVLIVCVNSDRSIQAIKGPSRPIVMEADRLGLLSALYCVDFVTLFEEKSPTDLLLYLRPHIHIKGGEYQEGFLEKEALIRAGIEVRIVESGSSESTTHLIQKIKEIG